MTRKYTKYTKELLEPVVASSESISECLRRLDLVVAGGSYKHFHTLITKFDLDTSHFLGSAHNRGKELTPYEGLMHPTAIKKRILKDRGHECEECHNTEWMGQPIPLELEHVDGNNSNNSKTNLKLLCCNCHALTPTWRRSKSGS